MVECSSQHYILCMYICIQCVLQQANTGCTAVFPKLSAAEHRDVRIGSSRQQDPPLWTGYVHQAHTTRQNRTWQSQMKRLLVLSGFLDQKFAGNLEEVGQIVPVSARISLCLQKEMLSGVVWHVGWLHLSFWSRLSFRLSPDCHWIWDPDFPDPYFCILVATSIYLPTPVDFKTLPVDLRNLLAL